MRKLKHRVETNRTNNLPHLRVFIFGTIFVLFFFQLPLHSNLHSRNEDKDEEQLFHQPWKAINNYKILGFVSYNFRILAKKWFERLQDLGYNEHAIVVFDDEMIQYLDELNWEHAESQKQHSTSTTNRSYFYRYETFVLPPLAEKFQKLSLRKRKRKRIEMLFALRWHYILSQLKNGTSILLTDVDNIFNQHIDPTIHPEFVGFDVIHAYASGFPEHIHKQIGFTICGCMSWLKATPQTIQFVEKFIERCGSMCDDQILINELIADGLDIEWANNATRKARFGRSKVTGHTVKIFDRDWVYRGWVKERRDYPFCPGRDDNWIAMPHPKKNILRTPFNRDTAPLFKTAMFDYFDKTCRLNNTKKNIENTKKNIEIAIGG